MGAVPDFIHAVNRMRNVSHYPWAPAIKRVVVILAASRSGSSLMKSILAMHPHVASLDGEMEPFLALTGNGFGYNSDSDAIGLLSNKSDVLDNIFDNLTLPSNRPPPPEELAQVWSKRLLLQFPKKFSKSPSRDALIRFVAGLLGSDSLCNIRSESAFKEFILSRTFKNDPWRISYYDGQLNSDRSACFDGEQKIEEPPFIVPRYYGRAFKEEDCRDKVLLFKSPEDAYRIGIYEQLFPNAEIIYIHLTRGFAQTVNGLMDGWKYSKGFFSHDVSALGVSLGIRGYSDICRFGKRWWKFDMPPNWMEFTHADLTDVCLNQWMSANAAILSSGVQTCRISFEEFLSNPSAVMNRVTRYAGLSDIEIQPNLPITMATEAPRRERWKKREGELLALANRREVREMMGYLEHGMGAETWV